MLRPWMLLVALVLWTVGAHAGEVYNVPTQDLASERDRSVRMARDLEADVRSLAPDLAGAYFWGEGAGYAALLHRLRQANAKAQADTLLRRAAQHRARARALDEEIFARAIRDARRR